MTELFLSLAGTVLFFALLANVKHEKSNKEYREYLLQLDELKK